MEEPARRAGGRSGGAAAEAAAAAEADAAPAAATAGPLRLDCALRLRPTHAEAAYWRWRCERDVAKLDFAYAMLTLCRSLTAAGAPGGPAASWWWLALLLAVPAAQLACMMRARGSYSRVRLPLVCALRLAWLACCSQAMRGSAAAAAAAAAADSSGDADLAMLCTAAGWLLHLALQPVLQPLPFAAQLPLQLAEAAALLAGFHAAGGVARLELRRGLASSLHALHAALEGVFHVGAGFVFVTPRALAGCGPGDLRQLAHFLLAYAGVALPVALGYKAELLSKAAYALSQPGPAVAQQRDGAGSGGEGGGGGEPFKLVGALALVDWELLITQQLNSARARVRDDVLVALLLLVAAWGLCVLLTPGGP